MILTPNGFIGMRSLRPSKYLFSLSLYLTVVAVTGKYVSLFLGGSEVPEF